MNVPLQSLLLGTVQPFGPQGEPSAYRKAPVEGPVPVGPLGLSGDQQADRENHGGTDKAVLHYAFDHYTQWRAEQPSIADRFERAGAFGENVSTLGITEAEVCIGDRFRLGSAVVEISQGRQPCWKLGHYFGDARMVKEVVRTRRSGWYYRVIEDGQVSSEDRLELLDRPHEKWPVDRVFGVLVGSDRDPQAAKELASMSVLAASWRRLADRVYANLRRR